MQHIRVNSQGYKEIAVFHTLYMIITLIINYDFGKGRNWIVLIHDEMIVCSSQGEINGFC